MGQLDQQLHHHGHQAEARSAQDRQHYIRAGVGAGLGHPDEDEVAECDDGRGDLASEDEGLCAVEDWRRDGRGDEADDDEDCAGESRIVVGEAVGHQDLADDGGD